MNCERLVSLAKTARNAAVLSAVLILLAGLPGDSQPQREISGVGGLRLCMRESEFRRAFAAATGPTIRQLLPDVVPTVVYSLPPITWPPGTGLITSRFEVEFLDGRLAHISLIYTGEHYPGRLRDIYSTI